MKRYKVTGRPLSPPYPELASRKVGDIFEDELDADVERALIGQGALEKLPAKPEKKAEKK